MEKRPKVSVIIPTYNRKDLLPEAIDSVLDQTFRDFEIIVVDDGSTDSTGEMLKTKYGDRIRYFFKENGGCATARNYGIREARGEYIAFLDSDDRYLPNKLAGQVGVLDHERDVGFVYSDAYACDGALMERVCAIRPDKDGSIAYPLFATTFLASGSFLVRRSCLDKAGYYDEQLRYNEDTDFFLRIAMNCKVYYSDEPTFAFRIHTGRKSSNVIKLLESLYSSSENFIRQYPSFKEKIGSKAESRLGQIKLEIALEYWMRNEHGKAGEELALSQALYPTLKKRIYSSLIRHRVIDIPFIRRIVFFEEGLQKALKWYIYKYTGRIY